MDRVKFYSNVDMSSGHNFSKALDIMKDLDVNKDNYSINDIIELHNILKFLNDELLLQLKKEDYDLCNNSKKALHTIIGKFCGEINESNIKLLLLEVERNYEDDFFELLGKYKIYKRIPGNVFSDIGTIKQYYLSNILANKDLVDNYDSEIRTMLMNSDNGAGIIINEYEIEHIGRSNKIYFPNSLTLADKETIIQKYVESESPNLNYLRIIENHQKTSELCIGDKIKLLAKKKGEEEEKKFFDKNSGMKMLTSVEFKRNINKAYEFSGKNQDWKFAYNLDWIEENKDFSTLLNNFIYLFEFVDNQMRWTMVSKINEMGVLERHILLNSKRDYPIGIAFNRLNQLSDLQMIAYYNQLRKLDIRLEEIIEWFFSKYLLEEFKIQKYNISMPTKDSNYLEKCRTLLPEMDSCLKQYNYYVEDGIIDPELVSISSTHMLFMNVKSILDKKYVYPIKEKFNLIAFYFFSDQCMLSYIEGKEEKYENFFELIIKENIKRDEIAKYEQSSLDKLISDEYVFIDSDGYIKFLDIVQIKLLKDINDNDVISYWKLSKRERERVDSLIEKGIFRQDSSLFSTPEQDYLNYYLNKSEFTNSLDLRNMYSHGTQPFGNENIHYSNYIRFLRLFILIIIKINDELCIYNSDFYRQYLDLKKEDK